MAICGDEHENPMNGNTFICTEKPDHDKDGTMHEADTMKGPVNW